MKLSASSRDALESVALPVLAMAGALLLFGAFIWAGGKRPVDAWVLLFQGAFGDWFSWQNTLQRAAPLMLTALCVAIPARAGLTIIGGEGALVLGGLACAGLPYMAAPPGNWVGTALLLLAAMAAGAAWIALAGALRQYRGVNETISSLLLAYTAIALFKHFVEGPMRDPASLNKPSTRPLDEAVRIGGLWGTDIHWGLMFGIAACVLLGPWLFFTPRVSPPAWSAATRAPPGSSACRAGASSSPPARSAAPARGWPAASKWRRCTPRRTPR